VVQELRTEEEGLKPGDFVAVYPLIGCGQCHYCAAGVDGLCRQRQLLGMHLPGGFAEYLKVPVKNLYRIPERMGFVRGALVEPLANALHFVESAENDRGSIAIVGAGPIGILLLQVARRKDFPRIAVAEVNANRLAIARSLGADLSVNPMEGDAVRSLEQFFGIDGCSAVFDAAGFTTARHLALKLVKSGGLVVFAGLGEQETTIDFVEVIRRELRMAGVLGYSRQDFESAVQWIVDGRLELADWVAEATLAEGQAIFEELARPNSTRIKVVLKP